MSGTMSRLAIEAIFVTFAAQEVEDEEPYIGERCKLARFESRFIPLTAARAAL
jgi:hypothetical protein